MVFNKITNNKIEIEKKSGIPASYMLGQVISFFLLPLYTRYLTPDDYGVIAMLGILSVLQVPRRSAWLTLGAGLALLGLLGTSARADLLAHLFGFASGVAEGWALRRLAPPRRSLLQPAIALLAALPIVLAWWRALAA